MLTETFKELREKLSTQSAIAEHMTKECADLRTYTRTIEDKLAAHKARVAELSALLHPVTTGELEDIFAWVDTRLQPVKPVNFATPDMDEPRNTAFERGEHLLESIRDGLEKTCDDTAINVLATALRGEMDTARKLRGELRNKHDVAQEALARAEKAESELTEAKRLLGDEEQAAHLATQRALVDLWENLGEHEVQLYVYAESMPAITAARAAVAQQHEVAEPKPKCTTCKGAGYIYDLDRDGFPTVKMECPFCDRADAQKGGAV